MKGISMVLALGFLAWAPALSGLGLVERGPFIWPGFDEGNAQAGDAAPSASSGDYEFHAVYEVSGVTHVLLKDRRSSKFVWLLVGEESDGLEPVSYNSDSNRLLLASDTGETWLDLQDLPEASGTPLASSAAQSTVSQRTTTSGRRPIVRPTSSTSIRSTASRRTGTTLSRAVRSSQPDGSSRVSISTPRSRMSGNRTDPGMPSLGEPPPEQDLSPPDTGAPSSAPPAPPSSVIPTRP